MVQFGICGCGGFAEKAVLPMLRKVNGAEVTALFGGSNQERLQKLGKEFGVSRICDTFDDLVGTDDVDAVYISSPNVFHKEQTIAAARAGKHVLCEKPMAMNATECREMVDVCRQQGVKLTVDFCYPFGSAQQRVKELIDEGAIGEVSYLYLSWNIAGYGDNETLGWRGDPKKSGGGPLMDLGTHMVDLACFFLNDTVESVMAYVRPARSDTEIEIDALAMFEFSRGARASLDTSFVRGNKHNYTVVGTAGQIHALGTMGWRPEGKITLRRGLEEQDVPFDKIHGFGTLCRLFCQAVEQDQTAPAPGEAGLHVQAVIDAIYLSSQTGKRCPVDK